MAYIQDIDTFEELALNTYDLADHLIFVLYSDYLDEATHGGRLTMDPDAEYDLEDSEYYWRQRYTGDLDALTLVTMVMNEGYGSPEYPIWEEFVARRS